MFLQIVAVCYAVLRALLTWGVLRRQPTTREQPFVSVLAAARNEAAHLPHVLESLTAQQYPNYELIVVDDRSVDETPTLLEGWQRRDQRVRSVRVTTEPEGRSPKIEALKHGVAVARGDLLLFTDADCTVSREWIKHMVALFTPDVGAVVGYVELDAPNKTLIEQVQVFDYFAMMAVAAGATKLGWTVGAAGASMGYRRSAYDAVGGFEAFPKDIMSDDMALIQRVVDRTAYRVAFCDDRQAVVRSAAVPTLRQFIDQRLRWFAGGNDVLHRNVPLLLISSTLGMFNGVLLTFPVFLLRPYWRRVLVQALALRLATDLISYGIVAQRVGRPELLRFFPLWFPVQIISTNLLPLLSMMRGWSWKGHRNNA